MPDMRPLIILPGWGHGRESWEALIPLFAPREARVIELPGFGAEPPPRGAWGVPEYAAWVAERLAPFAGSALPAGRQGFDLLGHSFGGRVAALVASKGAPGLAALVLYGSPLLYRPRLRVRLKVAAAKLLKPFAPLLPGAARGNAELAQAEARGMGQIFRKAVVFDETADLPRIHTPTLLLVGERDQAVPLAIAREAHTLIPGSELALLPGLGHNAHIENPTLFAGAVNRYLATHADAR